MGLKSFSIESEEHEEAQHCFQTMYGARGRHPVFVENQFTAEVDTQAWWAQLENGGKWERLKLEDLVSIFHKDIHPDKVKRMIGVWQSYK